MVIANPEPTGLFRGLQFSKARAYSRLNQQITFNIEGIYDLTCF